MPTASVAMGIDEGHNTAAFDTILLLRMVWYKPLNKHLPPDWGKLPVHPLGMTLKAFIIHWIKIKRDVDKMHGGKLNKPALEMGMEVLWNATLQWEGWLPEDNDSDVLGIAMSILWGNIATSDNGCSIPKRIPPEVIEGLQYCVSDVCI